MRTLGGLFPTTRLRAERATLIGGDEGDASRRGKLFAATCGMSVQAQGRRSNAIHNRTRRSHTAVMLWPTRAREKLLSGEPLLGTFWTADTRARTAGSLRWTPSNGAELDLLDATHDQGWPSIRVPFAVHGVLEDAGELTLPDCWVRRISSMDRPQKVSSASVALGEHLRGDERWLRATVHTAGLDAWRRDNLIKSSYPEGAESGLRIDVGKATEDAVVVAGDRLVFRGGVKSSIHVERGVELRPRQQLAIVMRAPLTVAEIRRKHHAPLLTLTHLALNRADELLQECFFNEETNQSVELLHAGRTVATASSHFALFDVADLPDFGASIVLFWALHDTVFPALDLIAEAIGEGPVFSRGRFLSIWTGLEAFCKERYNWPFSIRELCRHAEISPAATGMTRDAISLLGVTRDYLGHLTLNGPFDREIIEQEMVDSTRRLTALAQAVLLRELGIPRARREKLFEAQNRRWPLPGWTKPAAAESAPGSA
ncbi:ApeA N-terminal domain 1-containing protein [Patulibacter sp. S7RM1-6]